MSEVSDVLQRLRVARGSPTYQQIADLAGVSKSAVSKTMRGLTTPSWETGRRLIAALGGDPEEHRKLWPERLTPSSRQVAERLESLENEVRLLRQEMARLVAKLT